MTAQFRIVDRPVHRRTCPRRHGLMVIAALVCLLIITSIVGSMLGGALRARRQLHAERDCRQTELLVEAGAIRAAARLAADPDFRGDTWDLPSENITHQGDARVTTEVSPSADATKLQIKVVAEYPLGRNFPVRRSNTFQIPHSTTQSQE